MVAKFELEALRAVMEDLLYLTSSWKNDIADDVIRRDCSVLRRLMIEDKLGWAWRHVGFQKQPRIICSILQTEVNNEQMAFAQAGGAHYMGLEIRDLKVYRGLPSPLPNGRARKPIRKPLFLSDFLASTCIIVKGVEISRHDLIVYIANTLGGIHSDTKRKFEQQRSLKSKFEALDTHFKTTVTAGKDSFYHELLSIGQNLANSKDIPKLVKRIKGVLS